MHHSVSKYEDYLRRLQHARTQWAQHGFETARTRIGAYERAMKRLIAIGDYSRIPQVLKQEEGDRLILTFGEIQEFLFVSDYLLGNAALLTSPRVKFLFSGTELASGEKDGPLVDARNVTFEFHIAAVLDLAGLPVDLTGPADVTTRVANFDIPVECKRPQTAEKVYDNIRRAIDQLARRKLAATRPTLGVLALSIGKTITEGSKFLVAPSATAMMTKLDQVGLEFIQQHDATWFKGNVVDGVFLQLSTGGVDEGANRPYHATMIFVRSRPDLPQTQKDTLRALYSALETGIHGANP